MNGSEKFMGVDLHSNRFNYQMIDMNGSKQKSTFELSPESLEEFYRHVDKDTYVILEASTNSFAFHDLIKDRARQVILANTHKLKLISFVDKKTDKIDAEKLAKYLKMQISSNENLIEPVYVPEQTIRELRSLFTTYQMITRQTTGVKNRIHSILKQNLHPFNKESIVTEAKKAIIKNIPLEEAVRFQIEILFDEIEHLRNQKRKIEGMIKIIGSKYMKEIDILTSMTGVSVITALALIADIADITRFPNGRKLASYLRSTPKVKSSNEMTTIRHTSKFGRKLSISLLTQSYSHFKVANPRLKRWFDKYDGKKKNGTIRMAIFRNVIMEIHHMLDKREYHWYRNKRLHAEKMNAYYRFLEKNGIAFKKIA